MLPGAGWTRLISLSDSGFQLPLGLPPPRRITPPLWRAFSEAPLARPATTPRATARSPDHPLHLYAATNEAADAWRTDAQKARIEAA